MDKTTLGYTSQRQTQVGRPLNNRTTTITMTVCVSACVSVELLTVAHEPVTDQPWMVPESPMSCSSSASSLQPSSVSLPSSMPPSSTGSPVRLAPDHSSHSMGEELETCPSSISTSPSSMATRSPRHRSSTSSPTPLSSRGRSGMPLVQVEVVYVSDPQHIYVRNDNQCDQFDRLQHKVNQHCQERFIPVAEDCLVLG